MASIAPGGLEAPKRTSRYGRKEAAVMDIAAGVVPGGLEPGL